MAPGPLPAKSPRGEAPKTGPPPWPTCDRTRGPFLGTQSQENSVLRAAETRNGRRFSIRKNFRPPRSSHGKHAWVFYRVLHKLAVLNQAHPNFTNLPKPFSEANKSCELTLSETKMQHLRSRPVRIPKIAKQEQEKGSSKARIKPTKRVTSPWAKFRSESANPCFK